MQYFANLKAKAQIATHFLLSKKNYSNVLYPVQKSFQKALLLNMKKSRHTKTILQLFMTLAMA